MHMHFEDDKSNYRYNSGSNQGTVLDILGGSALLRAILFEENKSLQKGIIHTDSFYILINESTFIKNQAEFGGSLYFHYGKIEILNSKFSEN